MLIEIISILFLILIFIITIFIYENITFLKYINSSENNLEKIKNDPTSFTFDEIKERSIKSVKRRAQRSAIIQKQIIKINKHYGMFTIISILVFLFLFLITYFLLPNSVVLYNIIKVILAFLDTLLPLELIDFLKSKSQDLYKLFNLLNNSIGVLLSISVSIYIFTYRVRRTISISSNIVLQDNLSVFLLVFFTFTYGKIFATFNTELLLNQSSNLQIFLWIILFIISLKLGLTYVIGNMLRSVNFDYILKKTTDTVDHIINILCYTEKYDKELINYLTHSMLSVYQTLTISIEKNDGDSFRNYFNIWEKIITKFMHGNSKTYLRRYVPFDVLNSLPMKKDEYKKEDWFKSFYTIIVENHLHLCICLYNNNKFDSANECLKLFTVLAPPKENKEIYIIYVKHFKQIIKLIDSEHPIILQNTVDVLKEFSKENEEELYGILIYNELLLKAVQESDIKKISLIVYSMFGSTKLNKYKGTVSNKNIKIEELSPMLQKLFAVTKREVQLPSNIEENYKKAIIFMLLQIMLKSIEIGNYDVTGFLIKMFVTKLHESEFIQLVEDVYIEFTKILTKRNPYISKAESDVEIINPNFNDETIDYCTYKLSILLYGQQKYAVINKLPGQMAYSGPFCFLYFIPLEKGIYKCEYISYLFNKLDKAKGKYGLIYLSDDEFIRTLKEDVLLRVKNYKT
ncbi:hypothetical protein WQ54_19425 [Bacillus sp. SA1-12]|uniref:hypothetical protein n=1 Tax=Bacillus sp. SA1-12 TaxID=1455638 RepID=UPI000626F7BE|nr:hypothetical protein [Bacillus sp. SA1-12]KKI90692.1 hypothetical protein WQ54_19425 [Bacillus sp. SA1-12]